MPFVSEMQFYVRYAETDAMAVVHHASYVVYMEEARSHYARQRGQSYAEFERSGYFLVVSEIQTRFIAPARYDDYLTMRCWIAELKSRRITFAYEVRREETLLVTATSQHICITKDGQLATIPPMWRAWAD